VKSNCTSDTKKIQEKSTRNIQGWQAALRDAQDALKQHRSHGRSLRRSITYIEKKIAAGDPFPVESTEVPNSGKTLGGHNQPQCI
jgi:hypothetical protein